MAFCASICIHFPSGRNGAAGPTVPKVLASRDVAVRVAAGGFGYPRRIDRYSLDAEVAYGEDAPNTGGRKMPPAELGRQARSTTPRFPLRTTAECYALFPGEVKSSCPVGLGSIVSESDGVFDADPSTGSRRRPAPAEVRVHAQGENDHNEMGRNMRWLAARRGVSDS